jgi:hypothetical protein
MPRNFPAAWDCSRTSQAGIIAMIIIWHVVEKKRFAGPPLTPEAVAKRQAEIAQEEAALGGAG